MPSTTEPLQTSHTPCASCGDLTDNTHLLTWPMPGAVKRRSICLPVARAASRADKAAAKISAHAHNLKKSASNLKESKREVRWLVRVCACLSHEATQLLVYIAYILTFQVLSTTLVSCGRSQTTVPGTLLSLAPEPCLGQRHSSEHFGTKFIYDLLLEAPFLAGNPEETFFGVGEVRDLYDWGDNVLWAALLNDMYPDNSVHLTPHAAPASSNRAHPSRCPRAPRAHSPSLVERRRTELARQMDGFDWTAGVSLTQLRVREMEPEACGAQHFAAVPAMYQPRRLNKTAVWRRPRGRGGAVAGAGRGGGEAAGGDAAAGAGALQALGLLRGQQVQEGPQAQEDYRRCARHRWICGQGHGDIR